MKCDECGREFTNETEFFYLPFFPCRYLSLISCTSLTPLVLLRFVILPHFVIPAAFCYNPCLVL